MVPELSPVDSSRNLNDDSVHSSGNLNDDSVNSSGHLNDDSIHSSGNLDEDSSIDSTPRVSQLVGETSFFSDFVPVLLSRRLVDEVVGIASAVAGAVTSCSYTTAPIHPR